MPVVQDAGIEEPVIGCVSRPARPITFRKVERKAHDLLAAAPLLDTLSGSSPVLASQPNVSRLAPEQLRSIAPPRFGEN